MLLLLEPFHQPKSFCLNMLALAVFVLTTDVVGCLGEYYGDLGIGNVFLLFSFFSLC
jgi:hypothetical protein